MEDLLSKSEIDKILYDVNKEEYSNDKVIHLGKYKTSIRLHSKKTGLILINGNKYTGFEHIFNRHSLMSRMHKWDEYGTMDKPSKFRIENSPIEYLNIADKIFREENKNIVKNYKPELFDVYTGIYEHFDQQKIEYKLITYKNTGIIHTFFVNENKKPFNPKKILDLRKGWTSSKYNEKERIQLFDFSYLDNNDTVKAKVIVKCNLLLEKEEWYVELYNSDSTLKSNELVKTKKYNKMGVMDKTNLLDFGDTRWIEKIIKDKLNKH